MEIWQTRLMLLKVRYPAIQTILDKDKKGSSTATSTGAILPDQRPR